jgi:hypothetical protein
MRSLTLVLSLSASVKMDSGQLHTHDMLTIVQYSCNTLCTGLLLPKPSIKHVKLIDEIHSGTACTESRCATLVAIVGASLGHGTPSRRALMPFAHYWKIWVLECRPLSLQHFMTLEWRFFSTKHGTWPVSTYLHAWNFSSTPFSVHCLALWHMPLLCYIHTAYSNTANPCQSGYG